MTRTGIRGVTRTGIWGVTRTGIWGVTRTGIDASCFAARPLLQCKAVACFAVLETGIDALFTLLRRENRTELLPQLLHLQTAHRAVCFTAQPKGSIPVSKSKKELPNGSSFLLVLETGIEPATY